jgi:hypothetical protein
LLHIAAQLTNVERLQQLLPQAIIHAQAFDIRIIASSTLMRLLQCVYGLVYHLFAFPLMKKMGTTGPPFLPYRLTDALGLRL